MTKTELRLTAWLGSALLVLSLSPDKALAISDAIKAELQQIVIDQVQSHGLPAMSAILVDDSSVLAEAHHGRTSMSPDARPVESHSVYRTGSVGKTITDLAVLIAVDQSLLKLDEDVRHYLPGFSPEGLGDTPITLRQLMKHESGLIREPPVGHYFDANSPSLEATVESLNDTSILWAPGSKTKYSNAGLAVVGRILEKVYGMSYASILDMEIFTPLKMNSTKVGYGNELENTLARGYMWFPGRKDWEAPTFNLGIKPAGDIYSSIDDMAVLMISLLSDENRLVSEGSFNLMWRPSLTREKWQMDVGLGFSLLGNFESEYQMARHGGAVYGYGTELAILPIEKLGVYVAASKDMSNQVAKSVAHWLLKAVLAERSGQAIPEFESPPLAFAKLAEQLEEFASAEKDQDLSKYVGRYGWEHNPLVIYQKANKLYALIEWLFLYPLSPGPDGFFSFPSWSLYGHEDVWFSFDDDERATSVNIGHGKRGVEFPRLSN